jgi:hypothetical protein
MTILFPRLGSRDLQPYEAPFGRMMLAFGRATAAAIELVAKCKGSEAAAVQFVTNAVRRTCPSACEDSLKTSWTASRMQNCAMRQTNTKPSGTSDTT